MGLFQRLPEPARSEALANAPDPSPHTGLFRVPRVSEVGAYRVQGSGEAPPAAAQPPANAQ